MKNRRTLAHEGGAGQQVNIRVEHQDQHDRRPAQRAYFREPVIPRPVAHDAAQGGLHDARMVQQMGVGIGQHIGREGQRDDQRDLDPAAARKFGHCHQPCRTRAQGAGAKPHQNHQHGGGRDIARQDGVEQVAQRLGGAGECRDQHAQMRQQAQDGQRERAEHQAAMRHFVNDYLHCGGRPSAVSLGEVAHFAASDYFCRNIAVLGSGVNENPAIWGSPAHCADGCGPPGLRRGLRPGWVRDASDGRRAW